MYVQLAAVALPLLQNLCMLAALLFHLARLGYYRARTRWMRRRFKRQVGSRHYSPQDLHLINIEALGAGPSTR